MSYKVVVCGAGFLGELIAGASARPSSENELGASVARQIVGTSATQSLVRRVQLSSRNPAPLHAKLEKEFPRDHLLPPVSLDITKPNTLTSAFEDAAVIVSLVGLMHGSPQEFDDIQWHGAENVARAASRVNAKLVHFSAIGADPNSHIPYVRTKGLAEKSVMEICPGATIIRPSLVFGPEDDFFNVCLSSLSWRKRKLGLTSLRDSGSPSWQGFCHSYPFTVVAQHSFSPYMSGIWHEQWKSLHGRILLSKSKFLER
jgi:nucleoside-diphosphate-sugar epimerase